MRVLLSVISVLIGLSAHSAASAATIRVDFSGLLFDGTALSGFVLYDSASLATVNSFPALQFTATVDGVTATNNGNAVMRGVRNLGCCGGLDRDFIESGGAFTGFMVNGREITTVGFSLFEVRDPMGMPVPPPSGFVPMAQAEFDAFPTGFSSGGAVPGGRRVTARVDGAFLQGTLLSVEVSTAPVPAPASLPLLAVGLGLALLFGRQRAGGRESAAGCPPQRR